MITLPLLLFGLSLLGALRCGGEPSATVQHPGASSAVVSLIGEPEPGWGAVFWREGRAWKTGGGSTLAGPRGIGSTTPGAMGVCGEEAKGAPDHAALALPGGSVEAPREPSALQSTLVETANWRLDALLPPPDPYTPATPDAEPGRQRGVLMGSLIKMRRFGAPPVLIASGVRDCMGVIAVLDATASAVLDHQQIPGVCNIARLLPPADLDGDKSRETAFFNDQRVVAFRLLERSGGVKLQPIGDWRCESGG